MGLNPSATAGMAVNTNEDTEPHVQPSSLVVPRKGYGTRKGPASVGLCASTLATNQAAMQKPKDEARQYIKGKIAEIIFEQMFRYAGNKYTVSAFGYEHAMPEIVQSAIKSYDWDLLETVRHAPDFALVTHDPEQVMLVEVKYRSRLVTEQIKRDAAATHKFWKEAWIFYATPKGFFFNKCGDLLNKGYPTLERLKIDVVPHEMQIKYIGLLNEFIQ